MKDGNNQNGNGPAQGDKAAKGAADRAARQAEALRANLQRRKAQNRARRDEGPDGGEES